MEATITADQLSTREVVADPYPAYQQLRDLSPFNYLDVPAGAVPGIEELRGVPSSPPARDTFILRIIG